MQTNRDTIFVNGKVVLPDKIIPNASVVVRDGLIHEIGTTTSSEFLNPNKKVESNLLTIIDLDGNYLCPGFIDLHVHGGGGADFMDGTSDAFETVLKTHGKHGTTRLVCTSTVAHPDQVCTFLSLVDKFRNKPSSKLEESSSQVLGAHLYGPYFHKQAVGCHPVALYQIPDTGTLNDYLAFSDVIIKASIAPELPQSKTFAEAAKDRNIILCVGHSLATFEQFELSLGWGIQHVDHLFCAMSDKSKLRQTQTYPMQGGVLEAALFFDQLTTEVIADGKHLSASLLQLAYKIKGENRLAIVTDCNRALDMPDGEYIFGPKQNGQSFLHRDQVGLTLDGKSLASSSTGMDHHVRTFYQLTGLPLETVIKMASLTPARIIGYENQLGSIEIGKIADFVILGRDLAVQSIHISNRKPTNR
ncbi:N-acetylglucosamine-6-phosphate deacetylase [Candidatus Poribacteria bacterium]|nr:N-acetylglucosamine-6-phosphate deacetylase [Candidatus Poribacteria bacterium]